mmetsp:Transcript_30105/g.29357  ORF Transcript_30105/g.29357 Transcript_30105/m.29357 type:complete len:177 (+) Transcript_30105:1658-2188(+)
MLEINVPNEEALRVRLRQSISNSRKKGYHGNEGAINEIPKIEEQAATLINLVATPWTFYDEAKKEFLPANDPKWRESTLAKFQWVHSLHKNCPQGAELKPFEYAHLSDEDSIGVKTAAGVKFSKDRLRQEITNNLYLAEVGKIQKTTLSQDYEEAKFTWRELFMKLCFEQMLEYFA